MSEGSLKIEVETLRQVTDLLFDHLEEVSGDSVELEKDYFWTIDSTSRFNVYEEPTSFTIGQLSEAWSNLRHLDDSEVTSYALVWLADILRTIGEDVVR